MQGRILIGLLLATVPVAGLCADAPRRPVCSKSDVQQQRQGKTDSRLKSNDCRPAKPVPSLVDPTPVFLL